MQKLSMIITLFCIMNSTIAVAQSECRMLFFDEFTNNNFHWPVSEHKSVVSYTLDKK